MIVLQFKKFATLWAFNGVPVYIGRACITRSWLVWWWPVNWLAVALIAPGVIYRNLRHRHATPPDTTKAADHD